MKDRLLGPRELRELLEKHELRPRRRYGQNFVVDPNTIRKVVHSASLRTDSHVLEIGAGLGSLTLGLAGAARSVTAVEVDQRLLPLLKRTLEGVSNVEIVEGDVMKLDLQALGADAVVANLPYNLAASIVLKVLMEAPSVEQLTVMAQREVGERLAATAGSKVYGQTSVLVGFYGSAVVAGRISRNAFYPVPEVDSVLVRVQRRIPPEVDEDLFRRIVRASFAQRRKTLRNSLFAVSPHVHAALDRIGLPADARAEDVDRDGYVALTRALER